MRPHIARAEPGPEMKSTQRVQITVHGRVSARLAAALDGMTPVRRLGATELVGQLVEQAQLHGLLTRIRDLGLELESVIVTAPALTAPTCTRPRPTPSTTQPTPPDDAPDRERS